MKTSIRARRAFLLFAAVATIAVPVIAVPVVLLKESRLSRTYTCVAASCYKVIEGKRVWVTDWEYEKRWRLERARTRSVIDGWFGHLAGALDAWKEKRRNHITEEESQLFAERREQLLDRLAAKRAARRSGMEAFIAARTEDPGKIAAEQPPN